MTVHVWLRGLAAAAVGGAANSAAAMFVDSQKFNLRSFEGLQSIGWLALSGAIIGAVLYLKQSPIPKD